MSQEKAIEEALSLRDGEVYVLSGWAGTGKTWVLAQICAELVRRKQRVIVCAPTHAAVSQLSEKITVQDESFLRFSTLAGALALQLRPQPDGTSVLKSTGAEQCAFFEKENFFLCNVDWAIIDEASMIDEEYCVHIDKHRQLNPQLRIVYAGDPGQLLSPQSKKPSPVFSEIKGPSRTLTVNRRTDAAAVRLFDLTLRVRKQIESSSPTRLKIEDVADLFNRDGHLYRVGHEQKLYEHAVKAFSKKLDARFARVLAYRNRTVDSINRWIHHHLIDVIRPDPELESSAFWPGEPLVANEAFWGFTPLAPSSFLRDRSAWIDALSHDVEEVGRINPKTRKLLVPVRNNTALNLLDARMETHPFFDAPSWRLLLYAPYDDCRFVVWVLVSPAVQDKALAICKKQWSAARTKTAKVRASRELWATMRANAPVRHHYACTYYKAQGATVENVFMHWRDISTLADCGLISVEDYHRALYVGFTRASKRLIVFG